VLFHRSLPPFEQENREMGQPIRKWQEKGRKGRDLRLEKKQKLKVPWKQRVNVLVLLEAERTLMIVICLD
jgi:hypothetical protein